MAWTNEMAKGAYPSRKVSFRLYDPVTVVPVKLTADEVRTILTKTEIKRTNKLRLLLKAMAAEGTHACTRTTSFSKRPSKWHHFRQLAPTTELQPEGPLSVYSYILAIPQVLY